MKARIFKGKQTKQVDQQGNKANSMLWYWEPVDYYGDVLWSKGFRGPNSAEIDAENSGYDIEE